LSRKGLRQDIKKFASVLSKVDIEMMLLLAEKKEVMKKEVKSGRDQVIKRCKEMGLHVSNFDIKVAERFSLSRKDFGRHLTPFIIAGKDKAKVEEAFELSVLEMKLRGEPEKRRNARYRLGTLLGYPLCCVEFYADVDPRDDEEAFYAGWRGTDGTIYGECIATGCEALTVLSHAPCSLSCEETKDLVRTTWDMITHIEPEAREAMEKLSKDATFYFGDNRRFVLRGERLDSKVFGYDEVCLGHTSRRKDATQQSFFQTLMEGDRIFMDEEKFAIMKGKKVLVEISLLDRVRKPLLLVPGEKASLKRVRVLCIETVSGGERDLFGNMRLSLLVGDLKLLGHTVRCFSVGFRTHEDKAHLDRFGKEIKAFQPDVVFFYRVCENQIFETVVKNAPMARLCLFEGNDFYGRPKNLELVPFGRLYPLWIVEEMSRGKAVPKPKEPVMYVPVDDAFSPEMQRHRFCEPKETRAHIEVLGRHACPYQKSVTNNPLFRDLALPQNCISYGCSMCTFRGGKWWRCTAKEWVDSIVRQILWFKEIAKGSKTIRIVDHFGTQFLEELLLAFSEKGLKNLYLMFDARPEHILSKSKEFERIAMIAGKTKTKIDFACIGFENFSQNELDRLNKGLSVRKNVACARVMKRLWETYPNVYVNRTKACGFIMFTPWTTLEDLRENLTNCKELDFSRFRDEFSITRLRLYKEMPLYYLALKDGLLRETRKCDAVHGYAQDFPWTFENKDVERVYRLLLGLRDLGALKGKETEALEVALVQVEKQKTLDERFCRDPSDLLEKIKSSGFPWLTDLVKEAKVEDAYLETDGKRLYLWVKTHEPEKILGRQNMAILQRFPQLEWIRLGQDGIIVEVQIVKEKAGKQKGSVVRGLGLALQATGITPSYRWFMLSPMNPSLVASALGNEVLRDALCSSNRARYLHFENGEGLLELSFLSQDITERIFSYKKNQFSRLLSYLEKVFGRFEIVNMLFRSSKRRNLWKEVSKIGFTI